MDVLDDSYDFEWPDTQDYSIFDLVLSSFHGLRPSIPRRRLPTRFHPAEAGNSSSGESAPEDGAFGPSSIRAPKHPEARRHPDRNSKHQLLIDPSTREKIAFCLGVLSLWCSAYLMGHLPAWVPHWYSVNAVGLIAFRYFSYKSSGWHYFLADLCYYANLLTLIWLYWFPDSRVLYMGLFCLVHGPISWAIIAWRNSMVFHSLDKVTSLFIHIGPPMTLYTLRWLCPPNSASNPQAFKFQITHGTNVLDGNDSMAFFEAMFYGLIMYTVWQTLYFFGIMQAKGHKIEAGMRITSYTWLLDPDKNSKSPHLMYRLCTIPSWGRGQYQLYLFMFWQLVYALLTMLPAVLYYKCWELHFLFLCFLCITSVWNGASYYMEVFRFKRHQQSKGNE